MRQVTMYEAEDGTLFRERHIAEERDREIRERRVTDGLLTIIGDQTKVNAILDEFEVFPKVRNVIRR